MKQVRVDFNSRGHGGLVKASLRRANGPLEVGQKVLAVEPDEGLAYVAFVASIEPSTGRVWLEVDWLAAPPTVWSWDVTGPVTRPTSAVNAAGASVRSNSERVPSGV